MRDEIRANLITAFIIFIHDYADPEGINKKSIEERINCDIADLFKRQHLADFSKKRLGEDFNKAVSLYFHRFQTKEGFNHRGLAKALDESEEALTRHLKKGAVRHVRLLATLMSYVDTKPKGLLAS